MSGCDRNRFERNLAAGGAVLVALAALVAIPRSGMPAAEPPAPQAGPAPRALTDWPTYHGAFSLDGVAPQAPPDEPKLLWRTKIGRRVEVTPVVAAGRVFAVAAKGPVVALDVDGKQLWSTDFSQDPVSTPLLAAGGLIVAGLQKGSLVALDAADGKEKWRADIMAAFQGTPNVVDLAGGAKGVLALSQSDGSIHVLDLASGKALWKTDPVERCDGSAGVGGGRIAMGSCASAIHVVSLETARKEADIPLGGDHQIAGGVAISGNVAYAGTRGGAFLAADLAAGKILWKNEKNTKEAFATPAVHSRLVLFASQDGKVYALRRDGGEAAWEHETELVPTSPVVAGDRVVVSSGGSFLVLDLATGRRLSKVDVADELSSPAVSGGVVLVGADDGSVSAWGRK
jgi:outer membrane protein assembly factor BamB